MEANTPQPQYRYDPDRLAALEEKAKQLNIQLPDPNSATFVEDLNALPTDQPLIKQLIMMARQPIESEPNKIEKEAISKLQGKERIVQAVRQVLYKPGATGEPVFNKSVIFLTALLIGGSAFGVMLFYKPDSTVLLAATDTNKNGVLDHLEDVDKNGTIDGLEDTNKDGVTDTYQIDANLDGKKDALQDVNKNGVNDNLEDIRLTVAAGTNSNPNGTEPSIPPLKGDTNNNGFDDSLEIDTNGDGVPDSFDSNHDGTADGPLPPTNDPVLQAPNASTETQPLDENATLDPQAGTTDPYQTPGATDPYQTSGTTDPYQNTAAYDGSMSGGSGSSSGYTDSNTGSSPPAPQGDYSNVPAPSASTDPYYNTQPGNEAQLPPPTVVGGPSQDKPPVEIRPIVVQKATPPAPVAIKTYTGKNPAGSAEGTGTASPTNSGSIQKFTPPATPKTMKYQAPAQQTPVASSIQKNQAQNQNGGQPATPYAMVKKYSAQTVVNKTKLNVYKNGTQGTQSPSSVQSFTPNQNAVGSTAQSPAGNNTPSNGNAQSPDKAPTNYTMVKSYGGQQNTSSSIQKSGQGSNAAGQGSNVQQYNTQGNGTSSSIQKTTAAGKSSNGVTVFYAKNNSQGTPQGNAAPQANSTPQAAPAEASAPQNEVPTVPYVMGQQIKAQLTVALVTVEGAQSLPVYAQGEDGSIWAGTYTLDASKRINISFNKVSMKGKTFTVNASAFSLDGYPMLEARFADKAPTIAQDLMRAALSGVQTYADKKLNQQTVTISGNNVVAQAAEPNLLTAIAGNAASLFKLPQNQNTIVSVASLDKGTRFLIVYGASQD